MLVSKCNIKCRVVLQVGISFPFVCLFVCVYECKCVCFPLLNINLVLSAATGFTYLLRFDFDTGRGFVIDIFVIRKKRSL